MTEQLVRTHGVVDLLPLPEFAVQVVHLQGANRDLVKLLGVSAVGTFDRTVEFAAQGNRLLKLLESANIKLASVATDVFEVSGRLMLKALVEGKASLAEMAELAKGKLRNKILQLRLALEGKLEEHQSFPLRLQQDRLDAAERDLATLEQRIQQKLSPMQANWHCCKKSLAWIGLWQRSSPNWAST